MNISLEDQEMDKEQILENLAAAMVDGDEDMALENAQAALELQLDPLETVEKGLSKGMDEIGERFGKGEVFLPELLMAASAFKAAMEILKPELDAQKIQTAQPGTVLIGTVKGDVHNIGKDIVSTVLETKGFNVVDIGVDNDTLSIIQEAEKAHADVIALSCLIRDESARQVLCDRRRGASHPGVGRSDQCRWIWQNCCSGSTAGQRIDEQKVDNYLDVQVNVI
jgi:trimethylamine corrinoid protein